MSSQWEEGIGVYDYVNAPGEKGTIFEIQEDALFPLVVVFSLGKTYRYTAQGIIKEGKVPTLSLSPYTFKVTQPRSLVNLPKFTYVKAWNLNKKDAVAGWVWSINPMSPKPYCVLLNSDKYIKQVNSYYNIEETI